MSEPPETESPPNSAFDNTEAPLHTRVPWKIVTGVVVVAVIAVLGMTLFHSGAFSPQVASFNSLPAFDTLQQTDINNGNPSGGALNNEPSATSQTIVYTPPEGSADPECESLQNDTETFAENMQAKFEHSYPTTPIGGRSAVTWKSMGLNECIGVVVFNFDQQPPATSLNAIGASFFDQSGKTIFIYYNPQTHEPIAPHSADWQLLALEFGKTPTADELPSATANCKKIFASQLPKVVDDMVANTAGGSPDYTGQGDLFYSQTMQSCVAIVLVTSADNKESSYYLIDPNTGDLIGADPTEESAALFGKVFKEFTETAGSK
jgi:hypothetical protein